MNTKYDSEYLACTEQLNNQLNPLHRTKNEKNGKKVATLMVVKLWYSQHCHHSPSVNGSIVFARWRPYVPSSNACFLGPSKFPKQHMDPFSRFCTAHQCNQHTHLALCWTENKQSSAIAEAVCVTRYVGWNLFNVHKYKTCENKSPRPTACH